MERDTTRRNADRLSAARLLHLAVRPWHSVRGRSRDKSCCVAVPGNSGSPLFLRCCSGSGGCFTAATPPRTCLSRASGPSQYVVDSAAMGLASIAGVNSSAATPGAASNALARGHLLLLIAAVGVAVWLFRGGRPSLRLLVFVGAALTFWGLAGANFIPGREPTANRYQLVDATLLILIAAELFALRLRPVAGHARSGGRSWGAGVEPGGARRRLRVHARPRRLRPSPTSGP